MDHAQGPRADLVSRREALALLGAMVAVRSAGAAEQARTMRPAGIDTRDAPTARIGS